MTSTWNPTRRRSLRRGGTGRSGRAASRASSPTWRWSTPSPPSTRRPRRPPPPGAPSTRHPIPPLRSIYHPPHPSTCIRENFNNDTQEEWRMKFLFIYLYDDLCCIYPFFLPFLSFSSFLFPFSFPFLDCPQKCFGGRGGVPNFWMYIKREKYYIRISCELWVVTYNINIYILKPNVFLLFVLEDDVLDGVQEPGGEGVGHPPETGPLPQPPEVPYTGEAQRQVCWRRGVGYDWEGR